MKKVMFFVLALICVLVLVGCFSVATEESLLFKEGKVNRISVTSRPEEYSYSFTGNDARSILDYLSNLNLITDFKENPDSYYGMTWEISLEYENGDVVTIYHFGNKFIRTTGGAWYKMNYEEANHFNALLDELSN